MSVHAPVRRPAPAVAPVPAVADAAARLRALRGLSHYLEGYPYQPHHEYTEIFTTDPHYVREDVALMPPGDPHYNCLRHLCNAFWELIDRLLQYVSQDVAIGNIPGQLLVSAPRHTGAQVPDLAVWPFRAPGEEGRQILSFDFQKTGPPLLILEVVSHSSAEVRRNDWDFKFRNYARMGVGEYWLLDTEERKPLQGFRLTAVDNPAWPVVYASAPPVVPGADDVWPPVVYAPVPGTDDLWRAMTYASLPAVDDGWRSAVLGEDLRWDGESLALQRRDDHGHWRDVYVPPAIAKEEGRREGREEGRRSRDVEQLVRLVRDYGALTPDQLAAYRARLETRTHAALPDVMLAQARLLAFPDREARQEAVRTFVDTGWMPSPTDNGGTG